MYIDTDTLHATWHVGESVNNTALWNGAKAIQADGDELDYIRAHFSNIRMHDGRVVRWTNVDAEFIGQGIWTRLHK